MKNYYKLIPEKKKNKIGIAFFILLVAIFMLEADEGAPCPPFHEDFDSMDCESVKYLKMEDRNGSLDFYFSYEKPVEYIEEYLPHFLKINIWTETARFEYTGNDMKNITSNKGQLKLSIKHPYSGISHFNVQCLKKQAGEDDKMLNKIDDPENDLSYADYQHPNPLSLFNSCLEYEKFLFFSPIRAEMPNLKFDTGDFRFEFLNWQLQYYLDYKKIKLTDGVSLMLAPFSNEPWKQLLFNINPISSIVSHLQNEKTPIRFIFRGVPLEQTVEDLSIYNPENTSKLDDIQCFKELVMTETISNGELNDDKRMKEYLERNFSDTKAMFKGKKMVKGQVAVTSNYFNILKNAMPDVNFIELKKYDSVMKILEKVARSNVLVGNHISTLVFSSVMKKKATVIDATPKEYSCNRWIDKFDIKAKVISLHKEIACNCDNFSCYPPSFEEENAIDLESIESAIRNSLL